MNQALLTISSEEALTLFEKMVLSRFVDEKMAKLVKQNKGGTFQLSAKGHELIGVVASHLLEKGKDWSCPYYRDQPFVIGLGGDITELFGVFLGRATAHHSGGRMMPYHFSHKELRILCQSSVVGSQFLHAVGRALGNQQMQNDELVYVSAGDGATSQGDFHEAINFATLHKLGVIFMIHDNGLAISVGQSEQTAGGSIAKMISGFSPALQIHEVDGTNLEELYRATSDAISRGRKGEGPSLIVAHVTRLEAHSNSDDPGKYQSSIEPREKIDPLLCYRKYLLQKGFASEKLLEEKEEELFALVEQAAKKAEELPFPPKGSAGWHLFAPFEPPLVAIQTVSEEKITMVDAINHALTEEMEKDPYIVVFGQDVAHGKGGVFGATRGLTERFGKERCFNTPLAESTIVGIAIGMAMDGIMKPVAEVQFADYLWTGINQLFNEAASIHYRSNGEWQVPMTLRMPYGGYIQGGPYHSQSIEGFLAHCPGLKVVIPSNAADAKALLKTAIRDPNPVIFLEHKGLYRQQKFAARPEPTKESLLPFGQANVLCEGEDLTVVTYGMMTLFTYEIAMKLKFEGISAEVIDLRTIVPLDINTILASVKKTGKLLIVYEAPLHGGFGAEIAARVAEAGFESLDAPIRRVAALHTHVPYSKPLETEMLPQPADIEVAIRNLAKY